MFFSSTLSFLVLTITLASGSLHPAEQIAETMMILDFSADSDSEPDSKGEFTSATLEASALPESFTVCSAFMVDAWTPQTDSGGFTSARMFSLLDVNGDQWGYIHLNAYSFKTEYKVKLGQGKNGVRKNDWTLRQYVNVM